VKNADETVIRENVIMFSIAEVKRCHTLSVIKQQFGKGVFRNKRYRNGKKYL